MTRKRSFLTVTDLFCGAGGSSLGAQSAGVQISMAANHWRLAIDTHNSNFPNTDHDCADVSQVQPRRYPATDILIASPECTNHSLAKGHSRKAQTQESLFGCENCQRDGEANCPKHSDAVLRSRATMWDVPRFAEHHRYACVIVENVDDARKWECWDAWLASMHALGYKHRVVSLNSMFAHPTPQSRDRMYVVFWRKKNRAPNLDIRPRAHCLRCGKDVDSMQAWKNGRVAGKYKQQYIYTCPHCKAALTPYYYAALNAIDWSLPATRIGDRSRPLKDRTLGRIKYGLEKFGRRPLLVTTNMTSDGGRSRPVTDPAFTQTGSNLTALVSPAAVLHMTGQMRAHGVDEALSTQVASCGQDWLITRAPFVIDTAFSHDGDAKARGGAEPLATQSAQQTQALAIPPAFIVDRAFVGGNGSYVSGADEAMRTQTTAQTRGIVIPPAFLLNAGSNGVVPRGVEEVSPTLTCSDRLGIAMPPAFITTLRGTGEDQLPCSSASIAEALGTVSAGGIHAALVSGAALLNLRDYRTVEQLVTGLDGILPTQVTGPQTALAMRSPFLVSYYGGSNVVAGVNDPANTLTGLARHALVDPGEEIDVEDCFFRMLQPHEIGAAMAFPSDYLVLGNKRDQVKQYGNAVTPPAMEILIRRCVESLHPEVAA